MKWIGSFSKKETSLCRLRSYPHPALSPQGARVVRFFASLRMTMTGGGAERDPGGAEDGTPESSGLRRGSRLSTSGWLGDSNCLGLSSTRNQFRAPRGPMVEH